jgi:amino acid transporter
MSRAFPIAGSVYAYAGRGINDEIGFIAGWGILSTMCSSPRSGT